jgi:hypothetical protein
LADFSLDSSIGPEFLESNQTMNFFRMRVLSIRLGAVMLVLFATTNAFAGPPFQTDDPDPVEFRHFEMYAFELSDSTGKNAGGDVVEAPAYEVNYGVVPNVQLHLVVSLTASFAPNDGPVHFGIGDTEAGAKIRFVKERKAIPEIAIFPFFELPSGNADKGLGVGATWYRMPLWIQKSWGAEDRQWTSYAGGGEAIVPQEGYKDYPFTGWLVQRQISKKITAGGELFGHGAEGAAATSTRASTLLDVGGIYEFRAGFDLLFAAGRSVYGQPETYSYLALYWTWGGKEKAGGGDGSPAPAFFARLPVRW